MFKGNEIGIDLGTANILVYSRSKGIVLNEPAVVAINKATNKIIAFGTEAKRMIGKTPATIEVIRPLRNGVIADYDRTTELLSIIIKKATSKLGQTMSKPTVVICVPTGATSVDKRAIRDAVRQAGAKEVILIDEPVAAAIGSGLPVDEPVANMVIDIGGGSTEVAIISFGGVVACQSVHIGGDRLDEEIIHHVRKHYNILIGEPTAERIKKEIGFAYTDHEEQTIDIRGRDLVTGLPKTITLSSSEIQEALKESLFTILEAVRATLEECPAELSGDIVDRGIILTGGGSLLNGLAGWLREEVHVPVELAPNPLESVAQGTGETLKLGKKLQQLTKSS